MSEIPDSKYFLPYQAAEIMDEARLVLWEKSIRIGATFAMAFRAVRRRIDGKGNYLHTSVNETIAKEFAAQCKQFCRIFDVVGASDVQEFGVWNAQENRRETALRIDFTKQENWIQIFSSNPDALRGVGGDVGIDELTSHKQPDAMLAAAGGRAMWGHSVRIWTSHKGVDSCFNRMIQEERAKGAESRWRIRTTTLLDALDDGLLDKINEVRGTSFSREDFIADTRAMVGSDAAYEEECLCKPQRSGESPIKWGYIDAAKTQYPLERKHLEGDESFSVEKWAANMVLVLRAADRVAIGYDVARTGHLSAVALNARFGNKWKLMGLITMHKRKFGLQRDVIAGLMTALPGAVAGGDSTGLGMQVCEELTDLFGPARFVGVNFGQLKPEIGTTMVRVFEDMRQELPAAREHEDIGFDLAGIKSEPLPSGRTRFYESPNPVEKLSHCDMAWAIGLSLLVGEDESGEQHVWTWADVNA